jgi:hypothetical protein
MAAAAILRQTMAAQLLGHRGMQIGISHAEVNVFEHGMQASTGPRATRKGKRAVGGNASSALAQLAGVLSWSGRSVALLAFPWVRR